MLFKPLLAATWEKNLKLSFPLFGSSKLDGIRCLVKDGVAVSRNLKPIPNRHIQSILGCTKYEGLDGELIVGAHSGPLVYNRTNSGVMSREGEPNFRFWVFDRHDMPGKTYLERMDGLGFVNHDKGPVSVLEQVILETQADMNAYEIEQLDLGYEGIMVRSIEGPYKHGRSTANEGILFKVKRFEDYEAEVLDIQEAQANLNQATVDHLGHTVRSKHQANMTGKQMLGAMLCKRFDGGEPFRVAPGTMTHQERAFYWTNPAAIVGKIIKVKSFAYGQVDQPRFARFHGFRSDIDR